MAKAQPSRKETKPFMIKRSFQAPRELVFDAWTNPEHLTNWFAPAGFSLEYKRCEIKPGGQSHFSMSGPEGMKLWAKVVYKIIERPQRLVYVQSFSDENGGKGKHPGAPVFPEEMETTVLFEEQGGKTVLTLQWMPLDATDEEWAIFDGMHESMTQGWGGSFEKLDAYLASKK